ncbi:ATP-binding protein [Methylobacterium sp. yr596]|uniref:ATP-binding protein n=1 Tax=Methylobacterium sp. yr596 TaxID=1761800 RepID=UPI0008F1619A|nr:ATP-binding protein [Methylobacterium sp. yr596]SFE91562.1 PAS domain S-box-containing protein [Methylobacterium sp. yr596]
MTTNATRPTPSAVTTESSRAELLDEIARLRGIVSRNGLDEAGEPEADIGFMAGGGEMGALMRSMDWSRIAFGPISGWSQALRSAVSICLTTRFPVVLYYGPERALIYNDAWRPVVGDKHPWSFGRAGTEVWAEIWDIIGPMFDTVFETGEATWSDDQLLPLNRFGYVEECYFYYSYSPIRGEQGRVEGIFTAVAETTQRVLADRRTRLLRDLAARSIEAKSTAEAYAIAAEVLAGDPHDVPFALLYTLDADGTGLTLAGQTAMPGAADHVALAGDAADDTWGMRRAAQTGAPVLLEWLDARMPGLPGGPWPEPVTQARVVPVTAGKGGRTSGIAVLGVSPRLRFDERYQAFCEQVASNLSAAVTNALTYQEERARAERLAELDRAKTLFFSNVSHEFRTPLTLMLSPLEEILVKPKEQVLPDNRALATVAHRNGLRLLRLVNGLLDFSRVEAGRARAAFRPTDLPRLTAELAGNFRSLCEQAGLDLVVDCPPLDDLVPLDPDMWEKVVLNLLSNAFKFTFEGRIAVTVRRDGDRAILTVADTGTGIPAEELPRLFERFHRVEGARGRTFEGSGIGLALVQELVRLHHGSIRVESEPGRGSAFHVSLPFRQADAPWPSVDGPSQVSTAVRAEAFVAEARRWMSGEAEAGSAFDLAATRDEEPSVSAVGRILLADDNADMRDHVRRLLVEHGYTVETAPDGEAALAAARARRPDLLLTDVMMPGLDGFGLLAAVRGDERLRDLPVIMLSARAGDEAKVEGLGAGADDYLTKPFSARELLARVGTNLQLARVRREAAEALRRANEGLEAEVARRTAERNRLWETTNDLMGTAGLDGFLKVVNPAWTAVLGWDEAELLGRPFVDFVDPGDHASTADVVARLARGESVSGFVDRVLTKSGAGRTVMWTAVPDPGTALFHIVGRDLTDQHRVEEQLRQSQKMEAVGQLTGGIAHDFNNLLTGISGALELLESRIGQGRYADVPRYVAAAQGASKRAAALTHRLLAFSRRQTLDPKPTDANRLIAGMEELVRRTIGPAIHLEVVAAGGLWATLVDPPQLENALLNLCINARDAMPDGGRITVETANKWLDERAARERDLEPGQYVSICVTDTGTGMSPDVAGKVFDPFFTTKPIGQGTGLGLSMIHGFVRQSGGQVRVYSEVGQGTTMCLYLPRHYGEAENLDVAPDLAHAPRAEQGETVLIVDDEPTVRLLVTEVLQDLGYTAVEAADGAAGLKVLQSDVRIDLLVTDVGLPGGMNGRQVADAARVSRPDLKVLFITGYAENAVLGNGHLEPGMQVLTKPFTMEDLASRVKDLIGRG